MNKIIATTIFSLLIASSVAFGRVETTINSGWWFHKGDIAHSGDSFSAKQWERVNLPHTWNRLDAFDETVGYYRGIGWYGYTLRADSSWSGKDIILRFEGANQQAEVFVNGVQVGSHTGGYTAFNVNITKQIVFGRKNTITVKLDNSHNKNIPPLNADFTFYGGIYRKVKLLVVEPVGFDIMNCASDGLFIDTPLVNDARATVKVRGGVRNSGSAAKNVVVQTSLLDKSGVVVAKGSVNVAAKANASTDFVLNELTVVNPNLWSPENPYLYKCATKIVEQGKSGVEFDNVITPVGLRWFSFGGDGFMLNGKKYALKGANRHQDFMGRGNALSDDFHRNDYSAIKSLGFNFVRLAHYPQASEVYRTCDELGLLVWSEIPVVNEVTPTAEFTDNCLTMQREQIRQTYNHPSIILYGYMNEILIKMLSNRRLTDEQRQKVADDTRALAQKLEALTKSEAPNRNTVMAIHYEDGYNKYDVSTITDVLGYNLYFGWYYEELEDLTKFIRSEHKRYPNRPIIISEYGADADLMNHSQVPRSWDYSEEYQVKLHHSYLKQFDAMPFMAGYTLWNFADFGAEARADATPWINQKGIVTYDRKDKDVAWLYRAKLLPKPLVKIAGGNFARRVGAQTAKGVCVNNIDVFGNGASVELLLNGESLGNKPIDGNMASFSVPFISGENRLEALDNRGVKDALTIDFTTIPMELSEWHGDELAINVGSYQSFVAPTTKSIWIPDREYSKGSWGRVGGKIYERIDRQHKVGISQNIMGTDCNPLYQTFVEGIEAYRFDVPDGVYTITLCFIENNSKSPTEDLIYNLSGSSADNVPVGVRQFGFAVNGASVSDNLNLARDYGSQRAVDFEVTTKATDGAGIEVKFTPAAGNTTLSGIKIKRLR